MSIRGWLGLGAVALVATAGHGEVPGDWLTGLTGRGTARWVQDGGRLAYHGGATFGWAVLPTSSLRDGFVQVRFKPVAGREDRAGGVVWRWRDGNNYYVARGNALEGNVVAYKVVGGRRSDLKPVGAGAGAYGAKVPVAPGVWHVLRVDFAGPEFTVTFDGRRLFTVRDETLPGPGAVGIWSKADSVTEFEGFEYGG